MVRTPMEMGVRFAALCCLCLLGLWLAPACRATASLAPSSVSSPASSPVPSPTPSSVSSLAPMPQIWPAQKNITMLVPFAADGANGRCARLLAAHLTARLGQTVRVVYLTADGLQTLPPAQPDGYTVAFVNTTRHITIHRRGGFSYGFENSEPVGGIMEDAPAVLVRADGPFTSLQSLVDHVRENPDTVRYGTPGKGSDGHVTAIMVGQAANIRGVHTPLSGVQDMLQHLRSGSLDAGVCNLSDALPYLRNGTLRCLGTASDQRLAEFPEVPTLAEQGYEVIMPLPRGLVLPTDTPPNVAAAFVDAVRNTAEDPLFLQQAGQEGLVIRYSTPAEFGARLLLAGVLVEKAWKTLEK